MRRHPYTELVSDVLKGAGNLGEDDRRVRGRPGQRRALTAGRIDTRRGKTVVSKLLGEVGLLRKEWCDECMDHGRECCDDAAVGVSK